MSGNPALPHFIIIGTMKGGTTSLHYYLGLHPEITVSRPKETNFFIEERNWGRSLAWYAAHFKGTGRLRGEASPNYAAYPHFTGAPEHMHEVLPQAQLIYILRDPIERMLAHYVHIVSEGRETRTPGDALSDTGPNAYIARSRYHMQLARFLAYYPRERVLLLTQEALYHRRAQTLRTTFRFLGANESFQSPRFHHTRHHSRDKRRRSPLGQRLYHLPQRLGLQRVAHDFAYHLGYALAFPFSRPIPRPQLDPALRAQLVNRLADDLAALRAATGQAFDEWSC